MVIFSISNTLHANDGAAFMLVECMERYRAGAAMLLTAARLWWWNAVMLDLDQQHVRYYWCVLGFEAVIRVRCSMRS